MSLLASSSFNVSFFDEKKAQKNFHKRITFAVGYARLSFDEDGEGFCSIINQQNILKKLYEERFESETSTYEFIADDNVSGYKFERPGLFKILKLIEEGRCNLILAKDLSRIGRHGALTQLFIEQCERVGVRIMAMDDYDSHKESDDLILGIRAWSNERVVKDASAKILKIVRHKQSDGSWFCAAPYGYKVVDYQRGIVEIDEEAAAVVKRIANMYLGGMGVNGIAKTLTFEGVAAPVTRARQIATEKNRVYKRTSSGRWAGCQVAKMLDDDYYIGVFRTGKYKRQGINGRDIKTDADDHHVFLNHHPSILTKEVYEEIKRRRDLVRKSNYRGERNGPTLYHGLLWCGDCGSRMYTYKNKTIQRQYVCSTHFKYGNKVCTRHTLKESTLTNMLIEYLRLIRATCSETLDSLNDEIVEAQRDAQKQKVSIQTIEAKIDSLKKQEEMIELQRIKQIIAHPEREDSINGIYDKMLETTQQSIKSSEKELELLTSALSTEKVNTKKAKTALGILSQIIDSKELTRRDIELLLDKVIVFDNGRVEIHLNPDVGVMNIPSFPYKEKDYKCKEKDFEVANINVVSDGDPSLTTFINEIMILESLHEVASCFLLKYTNE